MVDVLMLEKLFKFVGSEGGVVNVNSAEGGPYCANNSCIFGTGMGLIWM